MDPRELEQILSILKQNDVTEFELENNGVHLRLSRSVPRPRGAGTGSRIPEMEPAIVGALSESTAPAPRTTSASFDQFVKVESPLVGTFYRKPSPDADVFVKEGDSVKKGDTLCIVEAMKLMNEIDAPCDGKIEKVLGGDGQVVEFGEVLFLIDPSN